MSVTLTMFGLICNTELKDDCEVIRQYVEASGKIGVNNSSDRLTKLSKIPFRTFCDTFWASNSRQDENIELCQRWWKCLTNQWQCRSGQCIDVPWILDGEWDCVDASDEQGIFVLINTLTAYDRDEDNTQLFIRKLATLYNNQSFGKICNLSVEYPCFRANVSNPLNITQNRPCINLQQIGDGHVDCAGVLDERNNLKHCLFPTMLGYSFQCSSIDNCISYSSHCPTQCNDNYVQCYGYKKTFDCSDPYDFMCLNGQCAKDSWCDQKFDCLHGEDELYCINRKDSIHISLTGIYREAKQLSVEIKTQRLELPQLPFTTNESKVINASISIQLSKSTQFTFTEVIDSSIPYYCNRGIGVYSYNQSIVCFCPPQYYGDKCQFHIDRVTIVFHLNLSQSIYAESNNQKMMLKLLIVFLNRNEPLMTESFETQINEETMISRKKIVHLFYSQSNTSLNHKRWRYFNRTNIIDEHPYSIRIEVYELNLSEKPQLVGVWLYPIYFDFLPSFRLAKVLHLTKSYASQNPCSSNPCNSRQECHQILNEKSTYVCLCRPNFKGYNCSIIDKTCEKDYCSSNSLCKPTYRGLLNGRNKRPYCICPLKAVGDRCDLIHDQCNSDPCQNNGTCLPTPSINRFFCLCDDYHYGDQCQLKKREVRLFISKTPLYRAAVVQYFAINFHSLDLLLVHQRIYIELPNLLHYLHKGDLAPAIILIKLYSNTHSEIYLVAIQIDVESIYGTIELNQINHCVSVETLFKTKEEISPIKYHYLCNINKNLLCFIDEVYLCICVENHTRSECFGYNQDFDQCSFCLSNGKCLKENRWKSNFICLCPRCHMGKFCEFNSEYFSFTVDQLFSTNLSSKNSIEKQRTIVLLIVGSWLLFLFDLINNICSFLTFRRGKCLRNGIGYYLLWMSIMNQINLTFLALRLTHLTLNKTDFRSNPLIDKILCKILNYLLISSSRIPYWLASQVAIERVYTTIFLRGQWLKKPHVAKCLIIILFSLVFLTGSYEIIFLGSHNDINSDNGAVCILNFPHNQHIWTNIHKTVTIIHTLVPFIINIVCTFIISFTITRNKIKINKRSIHPNKKKTQEITELPLVIEKSRLSFLRDVLIENKELILGPGITLIPQLFSLPLFIVSIAFVCQNIQINSLRYLLIVSYITSFIPQTTSFFLYISPSSLYTEEWRLTILYKWFKQYHRQKS